MLWLGLMLGRLEDGAGETMYLLLYFDGCAGLDVQTLVPERRIELRTY